MDISLALNIMRRLSILARRDFPSRCVFSHQGLHGTYGNPILNRPLLGRARNVSESGRPQTPQRVLQKVPFAPRVSSLHNVLAERGCETEGGAVRGSNTVQRTRLSRRISNRGLAVAKRMTLIHRRGRETEREEKWKEKERKKYI